MRTLQTPILCRLRTYMIIVLSIGTLLVSTSLSAQEKHNIKILIEPGFLAFTASENIGLLLNVEPKLQVSKKINIGFRIGLAINSQSFENYDSLQFNIDEKVDNGGVSFIPTVDYYFKQKKYKPFIGMGVGPYLLSNNVDVSRRIVNNPDEDTFVVKVNSQMGIMTRGGIESSRLRIGIEYNYIQKANITIPDGQVIGRVDNSYLGLFAGFTIGKRNNRS